MRSCDLNILSGPPQETVCEKAPTATDQYDVGLIVGPDTNLLKEKTHEKL